MQLLSAEVVKTTQTKSEIEGKERLRKIRETEAVLAAEISTLRAEHATEKERLAKDLKEFCARMTDRITSLTREVHTLESRKQEALKPLREREAQVERRSLELQSAQDVLAEQRKEIRLSFSSIKEQREHLDRRYKEDSLREETLDKQEIDVVLIEERLRQEVSTLEAQKSTFSANQADIAHDLERRERAMEVQHSTFDAFMEEIEKERAKIREDRRAIKDGYEQLARSREEILGRKE